jgi:hypothetical protein
MEGLQQGFGFRHRRIDIHAEASAHHVGQKEIPTGRGDDGYQVLPEIRRGKVSHLLSEQEGPCCLIIAAA